MEIDPQEALQEFKDIVGDVSGSGSVGSGSEDDASGGGFMGGMVSSVSECVRSIKNCLFY